MKKFLLFTFLLFSNIAFAQNYTATQGAGTTFGAKLVTAVLYPQFVMCDPTTPSQCVAVNASGQITVLGSGNFTVTQATGTNLHAVLDTTSTTAVTQGTAANLNATVVGTGTFTTQSAITAASASIASGAFASGAFASGSYASGSIGSGAMVDLGAIADAAATAGSTGTLSAKMRLMTTQLGTINTTLGTPFQAGGSIGNTTFAVTNAGTFAVQLSGATNNINNIAGTVSLPTGASTAANQTNASQKTQIVDDTGNVIASTSNNLNVQCANCSGSGASAADAATFTAGTSTFAPAGGQFTSGGATACVTGHQCLVGITANRAFLTDLSSQAGTAITSAPSAYGTAPTGNVIGANVFVTGAVGLASASATSGQTGSMLMGAVTTTNPSYTTAQTNYSSMDVKGNTRVVLGGGVPITASATGTTAATTATLATSASVTTYICGFSIRANAAAAATGNATVTGTITGTINFTQWTAPNASGLGVTEETFMPCIPASAANTSIAVVSAAPGTSGVVSVSAWGYQQ